MINRERCQVWECLTCGKQFPKGTRCPDCDPDSPKFDPKQPITLKQYAAVMLCLLAAMSLFGAWLRWQYNLDLWHSHH